MLILLDVDGVCADFSNHLLRLVGSDLTLEDVTQWDIFALMTDEQRARATAYLDARAFWLGLPTMPGAVEAVEAIEAGGHTIVYATSPWHTCRSWGAARYDWLKKHFRAEPADVMIGSRKELLWGDVLIDDKPEMVDEWAAIAGYPSRAWLFDAPYNRDRADLDRVDWPEIVRRLTA